MISDDEGFKYPVIDIEKCINCKKCLKVCGFKKSQNSIIQNRDSNFPVVYAVKNKNFLSRQKSRSGGIFVVLSEYILKNTGIVYGCILDKDLKALHIRCDDIKSINKMQGSKYVQSDLKECYGDVLKDLQNGKKVLFSGTSCQIEGLLSFVPDKYKRLLLTIDIICHGVPSPRVLEDYLDWVENTYKSKCIEIDFRNKKKFGWDSHVETIKINSGKKINSKIYTRLFYSHLTVRPACYKCPYKSIYHIADITIGDYWGIDNAAPGFDDNNGVSLVLINNKKGKEYFFKCKENIDYVETKIENSLQTPLIRPFDEPLNRYEFWSDYKKLSFDDIIIKYIYNGKKKLLFNFMAIKKEYIKKMILKIKKRG